MDLRDARFYDASVSDLVAALDRQTVAIREAGEAQTEATRQQTEWVCKIIREAGELQAAAILQSKFSGATPRGTVLRVRDLRAALKEEE